MERAAPPPRPEFMRSKIRAGNSRLDQRQPAIVVSVQGGPAPGEPGNLAPTACFLDSYQVPEIPGLNRLPPLLSTATFPFEFTGLRPILGNRPEGVDKSGASP